MIREKIAAETNGTLTTKHDHSRIRRGPIPAGAPVGASPGERLFPTVWTYFCKQAVSVAGRGWVIN
jgi:hypothetical protein